MTSNEMYMYNSGHAPSTYLSSVIFKITQNDSNYPRGPENIICTIMMYGEAHMNLD